MSFEKRAQSYVVNGMRSPIGKTRKPRTPTNLSQMDKLFHANSEKIGKLTV